MKKYKLTKRSEMILVNWYSFVFSITSMIMGLSTIMNQNASVRSRYLGIAFLLSGSFKLIFIILKCKRLKRIALTILIFAWAFLSIILLMVDASNISRILTIAFTFIGVGIAMRNEGSCDD